MNPNTQILVFFMALMEIILPYKYILWPLWFVMIFIPAEQCMLIGGLNIYCIQIVGLVGLLRCFISGENRIILFNSIDKLVLLWLFSGAVIYSILWGIQGMILKAGRIAEFAFCYWMIRNKIQNWKDLLFEFNAILGMSLLLFPCVLYEQATSFNPFSIMGRVATAIREGRLRCVASFSHPILFGSYAAAQIPVIWGMRNLRHSFKVFYWICLLVNVYYIFASASSGPLLSLLSGLLFLCLFVYRHQGKRILFGICISIIILQIVMNAPIWFLVSRFNIVGGSTGWHRANLIDKLIKHIDEWALLGAKSAEPWGIYAGDVTNQFLLEGVRGGIMTMLVFIILMYSTIKVLGQLSIRVVTKKQQWFLWGLCCSILVDCVSFMSVSFFGQMTIFFILFLVIAALAKDYLDRNIYDIGI